MKITIASFKGGVGKTTTSVHLATYLSEKGKTLLVDGDPNRSASGWKRRGSLPFDVIEERALNGSARSYEHLVIDTEAHPSRADLAALSRSCDLLVVPTPPDALALEAMARTVMTLNTIGAKNFRILLTIVPPRPNRDFEDAREYLGEMKFPVFESSVSRLVVHQKSAREGKPVFAVKDHFAVRAWAEYIRLGEEILAYGREKK